MNLRRRIRNAALGILLVLLLGTLGYTVIGQGRWSFFDSFYMTVISVRLFREHCATEALEQGVDIARVEGREGIEG